MMLSCSAATELMEKKLIERLTSGERLKLFFHAAVCDACRRYEKQSRLLETFLKSKEQAPLPNELTEIAQGLEEKIMEKLNAGEE